jgi:hypothetical protein
MAVMRLAAWSDNFPAGRAQRRCSCRRQRRGEGGRRDTANGGAARSPGSGALARHDQAAVQYREKHICDLLNLSARLSVGTPLAAAKTVL